MSSFVLVFIVFCTICEVFCPTKVFRFCIGSKGKPYSKPSYKPNTTPKPLSIAPYPTQKPYYPSYPKPNPPFNPPPYIPPGPPYKPQPYPFPQAYRGLNPANSAEGSTEENTVSAVDFGAVDVDV